MKKTISGIRGIVGKDLTLQDVLYFVSNFASTAGSRCVIGMDTRPTSNMIKKTATAALMQSGIDVHDLGVAPTPVVFWEARKIGAGIMVTASHNPLEWNGLKFVTDGRGINDQELKIIIKEQQVRRAKPGSHSTVKSDYIRHAQKIIGDLDSSPDIVVDVGGGAAADVAPSLLTGLGCTVRTINAEKGQSKRGPDPTTDRLDELVTLSKDADIGLAYDYDGDRLVVVMDGKKQSPDATLALGVAKAIKNGYKKFVLSIDSSVAIERYIIDNGGTVMRSKVGEANVIGDIIKSGAHAGGEGSSGGFILPEFNYCRDGLLTGGMVASMIEGSEISDVLALVNSYTQIRQKMTAAPEFHDKIISGIELEMQKDSAHTDTLDGLKITTDDGTWTLIRASNTEDLIRISTESDDPASARRLHDRVIEMAKSIYEKTRRTESN